MIRFKRAVTICIPKKKSNFLRKLISSKMKPLNPIHICNNGTTEYMGFQTRYTLNEISSILRSNIPYSDTIVVGGLIIVMCR